jgi:hypothetical protein
MRVASSAAERKTSNATALRRMRVTKYWSIFTSDNGMADSSLSDAWPVPKSSRLTSQPASSSFNSEARSTSSSLMGSSSVSSIRTKDAGSSAARMRSSKKFTAFSSDKVVAGALTAIGTATPARRIVNSMSMTRRQTRSNKCRSRPMRLMAGMNSAGMTSPKRGCCHRASASADTILPVSKSICGCNSTRNPSLPATMAAISSSLTTELVEAS